MMYDGIASGSSSAQLITLRPGKRHMVTNQAAVTPKTKVPIATPDNSKSVVTKYRGRTVALKCGQIFSSGNSANAGKTATGIMTRNETTNAATVQLSKRRRGGEMRIWIGTEILLKH